jgi:hypothetical protein
MINKEVFAKLCAKLKVGERMVYIAINQKKAEYNYSVTMETAAYILAADSGIDISKYLEDEELAEVREARKGHSTTVAAIKEKKQKSNGTITKMITVNIGQNIKFRNGPLSEKTTKEAKEMAERVYPVVYLFENSARELILNLMNTTYGTDWWNNKVTPAMKKIVQSRIDAEDKNRWHSKRGVHQIFYTDMGDLISIIVNNWEVFKQVFPEQGWITQRFNEIELSRNIIAHNNVLEEREVGRIKLYFEDWNKQIASLELKKK